MGEAGHQERGRQQQQFGAGRGIVARRRDLLEVEPGHLAEQPAAQRPGAVVLAGDRQRGLGHLSPPQGVRPAGPTKLSRSAAKNALAFLQLRGSGSAAGRLRTAGLGMLYQAYQAHSDIMGPVRALAGMAARAIGHPAVRSRPATARSRNLTAAYELIARAGLTHTRPPFGIDRVMVGNREVAVQRGGGARHAVRHAAAFQEGHRRRAAARAAGRAAVGPFRDAAARHRAHACCPSTTSTSPTGTTCATCRVAAGPLRLRRLRRAPDPASSR